MRAGKYPIPTISPNFKSQKGDKMRLLKKKSPQEEIEEAIRESFLSLHNPRHHAELKGIKILESSFPTILSIVILAIFLVFAVIMSFLQ